MPGSHSSQIIPMRFLQYPSAVWPKSEHQPCSLTKREKHAALWFQDDIRIYSNIFQWIPMIYSNFHSNELTNWYSPHIHQPLLFEDTNRPLVGGLSYLVSACLSSGETYSLDDDEDMAIKEIQNLWIFEATCFAWHRGVSGFMGFVMVCI